MQTCNATHAVHTLTSVTQMYGGMNVKLSTCPNDQKETTVQFQKTNQTCGRRSFQICPTPGQ